MEFCGMNREIDRKSLNRACVHANAQSLDRCEGQRSRFLVLTKRSAASGDENEIGPLQDPVTWYGINYTGTQMTQWDFQNKGKSGWTGTSSFVLEVPLRHLRPSVIYSVPCDRILQRAY